ncbi:transcription factor TFIIIB subunit brf1 [Emydomyces testavorans]|uniref:B-related factor 1 n=1 Tax=Emydomyces testavorans TaxID=2070801 RepID=A0AAF0DBB7_9EURO|nr:transcription factor TFIIIB subunit brf1 [Emydomyces testavorans]
MASIRPTRLPPPSRAGVRPVERLASLKNRHSTPIGRPLTKPPTHRNTTTTTTTCPNPACPAPNIVEDDGKKVCSGCGTVISEANIVSEITFGESSSGAAIVQGTFIGADQSHVRSTGPGFQRGGGIESREITEQHGNRYIAQLSRALNVPESASKAAGQVFKLAVGLNFIQGRRTKTVAAICLYVACRRQDGNTVMLIDLADVLMINVFKLGRTYKALLDELRLGGNAFIMNPIDPESLIYRFAKQLEFGSSMMQVASEAVRIVQRMNRDWMITGRRPAGICGAALILAARMNNFRRTVREVVYVVKVTELTINQRLNEFRLTDSGDLTVDQFRSVDLETSHDPPCFSHSKETRRLKKGKKRKAPETAAEIENEDDETSQAQPASKRLRRVDADGFAIPDIPIDPAILDGEKQDGRLSTDSNSTKVTAAASDGTNKPTRRKSNKTSQVPEPTEAELALESALENEMTALLSSGSSLLASAEAPKSTSSNGETPPLSKLPKPVSDSEDIDPTEFDSDPEVRDCLLSPEEVEIKERIWVHENKDYLRTQQAKALKRALAAADPSSAGAAHKPRKRRKGRMGDVTYLSGDGDKASSRASTPAEATRLMLERRGFSKKINYSLLEKLYEDDVEIKSKENETEGARSRTRSRSRSSSLARSVRASSVASDRGYGAFGSIRPSARTRMLKGRQAAVAEAIAAAARARASATPEPSRRQFPTPPATRIKPAAPSRPEPRPEPEPAQPTNPNEEILGYIPEPEPGTQPRLGDGEDYDEDEEDEEEEEDEDDEDNERIEAAFAGNYYDEGSDGGYDDDY